MWKWYIPTNDNNTTSVLPNDSKSNVILAVSVVAFCLVIFGGLSLTFVSQYMWNTQQAIENLTENIEMQSMPTFRDPSTY